MKPTMCHGHANFSWQVVYQAGVNEKLLGDFIRKHNVRDKVFSKSIKRSQRLEF